MLSVLLLAACDLAPLEAGATPEAQPQAAQGGDAADDGAAARGGDAGDSAAGDGDAAAAGGASNVTADGDRPAPASLDGVNFDGPLVITEGGTYSGNWSSDDPETAAVTIQTSEPVVIQQSRLRSRGDLIFSDAEGADLTVRNTVAEGLNPGVEGQPAGRFLRMYSPASVTVTRNELNNTSGMLFGYYAGDGSAGDTFKIIGNRATNIDGRLSDGGGGFSQDDDSAELVQFVQFSSVQDVPGIEVAWNDVVNEPGNSRVEDVISVYLSSGTPDSPISIHNNYINGAYPTNPESDGYSGGGIMLGDGQGDEDGVEHVEASDNTVLNTTNYGMAIAAGRNATMRDNRVLSTGVLPDGTPVAAQNVGLYVWNYHGQGAFGDNSAVDNVVRWERPNQGERQDMWFPDIAEEVGNQVLGDRVTDALLENEYQRWERKAVDAAKRVGAAIAE